MEDTVDVRYSCDNGTCPRDLWINVDFPLERWEDREDFTAPRTDFESSKDPFARTEFSGAFDKDKECL